MIEEAGARIVGFLTNQIGGTFLSPSSTLSFQCLAVSLAVAVVLLLRNRRSSRPLRLRAAWRALFPKRMFGTRSGRLDAAFFVLSTAGIGALFGWAIVSAEWVRLGAGALFGHGAPLVGLTPVVASAIVTVSLYIAYEFAYWFDHWIKHRSAVLWAFHKVHHDAESLSILTNFRVHPVDTIIFYNLIALTTGVTAFGLEVVLGREAGVVSIGTTNILIMVMAAGLTHLQHSHFWMGAGLRGWLLGPAHHQIHHSADPAHHNRNLGSSLALWDRVFGTYYAPTATRPALRFGSGAAVEHRLGEALWRPFMEARAIVFERKTRASGLPVQASGLPVRASGHPVRGSGRRYAASMSARGSKPSVLISSGRSGPSLGA
jgi:sterol desaturase/sphingolipid hydroxylase (fatty acid hydroxylase superfamily)